MTNSTPPNSVINTNSAKNAYMRVKSAAFITDSWRISKITTIGACKGQILTPIPHTTPNKLLYLPSV